MLKSSRRILWKRRRTFAPMLLALVILVLAANISGETPRKTRYVSTWKPNIHCSRSKESDMIRQVRRQVRRLRFSMLLGVKAKDCRHQRHQRYVIFVESLWCLPGKVEWQDKTSMALHDCERLWVQNCPRLQMVSLPFSLFSCSWAALCCAACDVLKG